MDAGLVRLCAVAMTGCGRVAFDATTDALSTATWCDQASHTFCDDFDRDTLLEQPWDNAFPGSGTFAFADVTVSPPRSLQVNVAFPSPSLTYLTKALPSPTGRVRVVASLEIVQSDLVGQVDILTLQWTTPTPPCTTLGFVIVRDQAVDEVKLQETYLDCGNFRSTAIAFPPGFHDIELEVTLGSPGRVVLSMDGRIAVDAPTLPAIAASALELKVGASYIENLAVPWQLRYDNVAVDIE